MLLSQLLLLHIKTHTAISLQFVRMVFIFVSFFFTTLDQLASLYGMYIVQHQTRTQNCMDGSVRFLSLDKNWQNRNWISGFFLMLCPEKRTHHSETYPTNVGKHATPSKRVNFYTLCFGIQVKLLLLLFFVCLMVILWFLLVIYLLWRTKISYLWISADWRKWNYRAIQHNMW